MDLLDRLDDVDAGKGEPKRRPDPLDRGRGANHEGPADRRRVKRLAPEDRREIRTMKQIAQLRFRIGQALSIWRAIGARPDAAARRNDHDNPPLWRGNAPQLLEKRVRPIGRLESVGHQQTVNGAVGQRQHLHVHKGGRATSFSRPDDDALLRGHQGQASASLVAKSFEVGRSITKGRDGKADDAVPTRAYDAPDQSSRNFAERRAVEALQTLDVERHRSPPNRGMTLNERSSFRNASTTAAGA